MTTARGLLAALALSLAATGAGADPAAEARAAAGALRAAGDLLAAAEEADDRVAALTETVRAYEAGLAALREGLRRATIRERAIARGLEARRGELARLLGVMMGIERTPEALFLLHPSGPVGTARAGLMLGDVTPALQAEAEALRAELEEVAMLRALQEAAADALAEGLTGIQAARTALSQAMAERREPPRRVAADAEALERLLDNSDTLESFAAGLARDGQGGAATPGAVQPPLPLPAEGTVLRRFDEADAAGIRRPGVVLATRPLALVTAPAPATILYRGPLLDYGNVIVLEPGAGVLMVLAGLAEVYGDPGEVVPAGAPLGLMGGAAPDAAAFLQAATEGGGSSRPETLYIEVREGDAPVDPAGWFELDKE